MTRMIDANKTSAWAKGMPCIEQLIPAVANRRHYRWHDFSSEATLKGEADL
jgi:hypothetical protein